MQVFNEFDIAYLQHELIIDGIVYPIGTQGTIVHVYNDGEAYEFEVSIPNQNVITVYPTDLQNMK